MHAISIPAPVYVCWLTLVASFLAYTSCGMHHRSPHLLCSVCRSLRTPETRVRLALTLLYAVNVAISYMLMLAIMTYNVGYFFAIVAGLAVGYFIFYNSASPSASSDVCCPQQHA